MRSMTGFGRGTAQHTSTGGGFEVAVQVSSVNRKSLEVALSLPREWQAFEPELTALVRERASRGRLQVTVELRRPGATGPTWDDAAVESTLDRIAQVASRRGVPFTITPELIFQVANANRAEAAALAPEDALALIRAALEPALQEFTAMREREGAALARDITQRVQALRDMVESIAQRSPNTASNYRELLLQRLRQAGLDLDLNDERVLKEIALFADRIDISEELTRLRSHLDQLGRLPTEREPVGRKADFILQEISREVHTIGSKANDIEIARTVIEFKNEIERIREQVQNVE